MVENFTDICQGKNTLKLYQLSIFLSITIYLSICLSTNIFFCLSIYLYIYLSNSHYLSRYKNGRYMPRQERPTIISIYLYIYIFYIYIFIYLSRYKNGREFYRYMPRQEHPTTVFDVPGVIIDVSNFYGCYL